jgi:[acyl-carrier-protein] S-malonyltransferase
LYATGAVGFDQALRLVQRRGQLMQEAASAVSGGMVSLLGADETSARALCDQAREGDVLAPANFNCPGQIVISGSKAACARALVLADSFHCRAVALPVAGAFHSPLMEPAARRLRDELARVQFAKPSIPVMANVDGQYHESAAALPDSLFRQMTQPVLWQRCVERMIADGVDEFVEVGPGRVLTGLLRKINRGVRVVNVNTADALGPAVAVPQGTS